MRVDWRALPFLVLYEAILYIPYLVLTRHTDVTAALQHGHWLALSSSTTAPGLYTLWRGSLSVAIYELPHLLLAILLPVFVLLRRPDRLGHCLTATTVLVLTATALAVAFPSAPPWYLWHTGNRPIDLSLAQLNSFPSFHVALAIVATGLLGIETLGWYPVLVSVVVVITGQHYPLDVLGGIVEGTACYLLAKPLLEWSECTLSRIILATF